MSAETGCTPASYCIVFYEAQGRPDMVNDATDDGGCWPEQSSAEVGCFLD